METHPYLSQLAAWWQLCGACVSFPCVCVCDGSSWMLQHFCNGPGVVRKWRAMDQASGGVALRRELRERFGWNETMRKQFATVLEPLGV